MAGNTEEGSHICPLPFPPYASLQFPSPFLHSRDAARGVGAPSGPGLQAVQVPGTAARTHNPGPRLPGFPGQCEHAIRGHIFLNSEFPRWHVHAIQGPHLLECLRQHEHAIWGHIALTSTARSEQKFRPALWWLTAHIQETESLGRGHKLKKSL